MGISAPTHIARELFNSDIIMPVMYTIGVIIPVRDEGHLIADCIKNAISFPQVIQVIVICDRCTDDTYMRAKEVADDKCLIIEKPTGTNSYLGHMMADAQNFGLPYLDKVDYICIVDADTRLPSDYFEHLGPDCTRIQESDKGWYAGPGTTLSLKVFADIGGTFPRVATNDQAIHKMVEAVGYTFKNCIYKADQFLVPDTGPKKSLRRHWWGVRAMGTMWYEFCLPFLGAAIITAAHLYQGRIMYGIMFMLGYTRAYMAREPRQKFMAPYAKRRQDRWIKKAKAVLRFNKN